MQKKIPQRSCIICKEKKDKNELIRIVKNNENQIKIDCLTKAQQSEDLLLELINSVLEVSRIESGNAVVEEEKGDIYYCFEDIENTLAQRLKS